MNIIIVANFPETLDGSLTGRFIYLAELLVENGHNVSLITSDFDHAMKAPRTVNFNKYKTSITLVHEVGYGKNISIKRLLSHYKWGKNVGKYLSKHASTDIIYCAIPSITIARECAAYANKCGAKFVIDIQDLWPEAFCLAIKNKLLQKFFVPIAWYINKAYSAADLVVAVSDTYRDRGLSVNHKDKNGLTVYLGNNGERFNNARDKYELEKPADEIWFAYIGTLGYSYDLECAIDAIAIATKQLKTKLKFVVVGRGPLKDYFEQRAKQKGINYEFTGVLPYEKMVGKMCSCDIMINPIRKGAAQSITNKVGDYALSGKPVISTQECEEYRNLVEKYNCGINCECGNPDIVADAIVKLVQSEKLRNEMGANARKLGEECFDRRNTYNRIIEALNQIYNV